MQIHAVNGCRVFERKIRDYTRETEKNTKNPRNNLLPDKGDRASREYVVTTTYSLVEVTGAPLEL